MVVFLSLLKSCFGVDFPLSQAPTSQEPQRLTTIFFGGGREGGACRVVSCRVPLSSPPGNHLKHEDALRATHPHTHTYIHTHIKEREGIEKEEEEEGDDTRQMTRETARVSIQDRGSGA